MANTKEELKQLINELPLFEKRKVQVKDTIVEEDTGWTLQQREGICEIGGTKAFSFVTPGYNLVQFKEVFLPLIDSIPEDLHGYLCNRDGFASLKIFPEVDSLKDGDNKFGLLAMNSVDCSCSIIIKFVVEHNGLIYTIPPKVAGLKKQHSGNVKNLVKDYLSLIGNVKEVWRKVIEDFPKYRIVLKGSDDKYELEFDSVIKRLKIGKRMADILREKYQRNVLTGKVHTLWDIFVDSVEMISNKEYKYDIYKDKRIDALCQAVFEMSFITSI